MINANTLKTIYLKVGSNRLRYLAVRALKALGLRYLVVRLDTNHLCNLRCRMCYFGANHEVREQPMGLDDFRTIAARILRHTRILYLSCNAEPLCTPGITDFVRISKEHGVPFVSMTSNCMLLSGDKSEKLTSAGLDEIIVSVTGGTRETYEDNHVGATWDRLWKNLADLEDAKTRTHSRTPRLKFNYILTHKSIQEVPGFIEKVKALHIPYVTLRELFMFDRADKTFYDENRLTGDDVGRISDVKGLFGKANIGVVDSLQCTKSGKRDRPQIPSAYPCVAPYFQLYVRPNGDLRLCLYKDAAGNLIKNGLNEIAGRPENRAFFDRISRKSTCCLEGCPNFASDFTVQ